MKVERVNENKIKVLIDSDEARELNITPAKISENAPEVQKMFWRAIHMAEENGEFSLDGAKLFVETIAAIREKFAEANFGQPKTHRRNRGSIYINSVTLKRFAVRRNSLKESISAEALCIKWAMNFICILRRPMHFRLMSLT